MVLWRNFSLIIASGCVLAVPTMANASTANKRSVTINEDSNSTLTLSGSIKTNPVFAIATQPTHGIVTLTGAKATYVPTKNYNGSDSYTFTIAGDGASASAPATVAITLKPVADKPTVSVQTLEYQANIPRIIALAPTDDDGDMVTYKIVTAPVYGNVVVSAATLTRTATATYTPTTTKSDSFTLAASDDAGATWSKPGKISLTAAKLAPVQAALTSPTAVAAGGLHTCAIQNGGVACWGTNASGRLGNGASVLSQSPVSAINAGSGARLLSAGATHTCAVTTTGLSCWGSNSSGQLGNGTKTSSSVPASIKLDTTPRSITSISAGYRHTCTAMGGGILCWGANASGQLGNGTKVASTSPVPIIAFGYGATVVSAGNAHTCAVVNGGVSCWGKNTFGQLGNGTKVSSTLPVTALPAGSGATDVYAGSTHTCAVVGGGVKCWGDNASGQLGNGTTVASVVPVVAMVAASGITKITSGTAHTCALGGGRFWCWGENSDGRVSIGESPVDKLTPTELTVSGDNVTDVAAGAAHTCSIFKTAVATIKCGGADNGNQLGNFGIVTTVYESFY